MTKKVIFLDLDGPMIPYGVESKLLVKDQAFVIEDFQYLSGFKRTSIGAIKRLCSDFDAKVVTNSTHNRGERYATGEQHILNLFKKHRIDDLLHSDFRTDYMIDNDNAVQDRAVACYRWLAKHKEVTHHVAIDDSIRDFVDSDINYVETGDDGISYKNYEKAGKFLSKKAKKG